MSDFESFLDSQMGSSQASEPVAPPSNSTDDFEQFVDMHRQLDQNKFDSSLGSTILHSSVGSAVASGLAETADTTLGLAKNVARLSNAPDAANFFEKNQGLVRDFSSDLEKSHPDAAAIGKTGTQILELVSTGGIGGGLLASGTAAGALSSLATSNAKNPTELRTDVAKGAAAGALTSAVLGGSMKAAEWTAGKLNTLFKGAALGIKDATDLAETATQATLLKSSGDFSKATPEDFVNTAKLAFKKVEEIKNAKYDARNMAAAKEGNVVDRSELTNWLSNQKVLAETSDDTNSAMVRREVSRLLGNGKSVDFAAADKISSKLDAFAYKAKADGNPDLARIYGQAKDAIEMDINKAVSKTGSNVKALADDASNYSRDTFYPLKDQLNDVLQNKYTNEKYFNSFFNSLKSDPQAQKALQILGPNAQKQFVAAHVNSIKEASADAFNTTEINPVKYAISLRKDLQQNGVAYGSALDDVTTLADVLSARALTSKGISGHSASQAVGLGTVTGVISQHATTGGIVGAAYFLPKVKFLYGAGKILENENASNLLRTIRGLSPKTSPIIKEKLINKVGSMFDTSVKALSAFSGSGVVNKNRSNSDDNSEALYY